MGKSVWDFIAPIAGAALGSIIPGVGTAIGGALGSGLETGVKTGSPIAGLLAGGGSYLGGNLLGGAAGPAANSIGGSLASGAGAQTLAAGGGGLLGGLSSETVGGTLGKALGDSALGDSLGSLGNASLGSIAGSSLGSSIGGSIGSSIEPNSIISNNPEPWKASQQGQLGLPQSLSAFGGLNPNQQASNIATQGVYGGGNGPEENKYFMNLINRQLVDSSGNVGNSSSLSPIDTSYLSQLGITGNNSQDYLKGIENYKFS